MHLCDGMQMENSLLTIHFGLRASDSRLSGYGLWTIAQLQTVHCQLGPTPPQKKAITLSYQHKMLIISNLC